MVVRKVEDTVEAVVDFIEDSFNEEEITEIIEELS